MRQEHCRFSTLHVNGSGCGCGSGSGSNYKNMAPILDTFNVLKKGCGKGCGKGKGKKYGKHKINRNSSIGTFGDDVHRPPEIRKIPESILKYLGLISVPNAVPPVQNMVPNVPNAVPHVQTVFPPVQNMFPPVQNMVPNVPNAVPHVQNVFPNVPNAVPHVPTVFPPVQNVFPNVPNVFPPVQNTFPPVQNVFPPVQNVFPNVPNVFPNVPNAFPNSVVSSSDTNIGNAFLQKDEKLCKHISTEIGTEVTPMDICQFLPPSGLPQLEDILALLSRYENGGNYIHCYVDTLNAGTKLKYILANLEKFRVKDGISRTIVLHFILRRDGFHLVDGIIANLKRIKWDMQNVHFYVVQAFSENFSKFPLLKEIDDMTILLIYIASKYTSSDNHSYYIASDDLYRSCMKAMVKLFHNVKNSADFKLCVIKTYNVRLGKKNLIKVVDLNARSFFLTDVLHKIELPEVHQIFTSTYKCFCNKNNCHHSSDARIVKFEEIYKKKVGTLVNL